MTNMTTAAADMLKSARNTAVGVADFRTNLANRALPVLSASQAKESAKATVKSIFKF